MTNVAMTSLRNCSAVGLVLQESHFLVIAAAIQVGCCRQQPHAVRHSLLLAAFSYVIQRVGIRRRIVSRRKRREHGLMKCILIVCVCISLAKNGELGDG